MTKSLIWCLSFLNSEYVLLANMLYFSNPEMIIRSMSESDVRSSVEAEREQSFLASPEKYFTRLKDQENWFNIDLIIVFLFLVVNFIVGIGIRRKIPINDFKTYSLGNFKDPSIFFLTAFIYKYKLFYYRYLFPTFITTSISSYILKNIFWEPLS